MDTGASTLMVPEDAVAWLEEMIDENKVLTTKNSIHFMKITDPSDRLRVQAALDAVIASGKLAYPIQRREPGKVMRQYFKRFLQYDPSDLNVEPKEGGSVTIAASTCFKVTTEPFQYDAKQTCHRRGVACMRDQWFDSAERAKWLPKIWSWKIGWPKVGEPTLTSIFLKNIITHKKCARFPVTTAKFVYSRYKPTSVIDPCFGWGDRMAAAYACPHVLRFHGIDPRQDARVAFAQQAAIYNECRDAPCEGTFTQGRAEVCPMPKETFDVAFTSPPFFDLEIYANDKTQSTQMYTQVSQWMDGFLFPLLTRLSACLSHNGVLAIHMKDTYKTRICGFMLQFVERRVPCLTFEERLNMNMVACPLFKNCVSHMTEHIWIWRRTAQPPRPVSCLPHRERFEDTYEKLQSFVELNGKLPILSDVHQGSNLGQWCRNRRAQYKNGTIPAEQVELLADVPGWTWHVEDNHRHLLEARQALREKSDESFQKQVSMLREFVGQHRRPPPINEVIDGVRLGRWVDNRKQDHKKGRLRDDHLDVLRAILPEAFKTPTISP